MVSAVGRGEISVRIVNVTQGAVLAESAETAKSALARMRGLLGRKGLETGRALILEPAQSIHSFFMAFPFDALFVSRDLTVLHLIAGMKPFRISRMVWQARSVIEL